MPEDDGQARRVGELLHRCVFHGLYTPRHEVLAQGVKRDIAAVSPDTEVCLVPMDIKNPCDFGDVYGALYDWVRGYAFNPDTEQYWTHITTGTHVAQICMFLLVESRFIPGVLLQTAPPKKQTRQQPGSFALIDLNLSRYDVLAQRFNQERTDALSFLKSGINTRNQGFNSLIEEIERVAVRSRAPILLTGPTGAGKLHLARRMFELKKSRHLVKGEFVEVNCATLHGDGAASTLFGHKKGAFTGAAADRAGLLRTAHDGVLSLDEIGGLGPDEQAMLLKGVEKKRFFPMGSDREVSSDFQLIAGTNRDLRLDVAQGRFRDDLYARSYLWAYNLPGPAQRPEDLEPNVERLLARAAADTGRAVCFNVEAKAQYLRFAQSGDALWSGNFRDLSASVTRLATLADGGAHLNSTGRCGNSAPALVGAACRRRRARRRRCQCRRSGNAARARPDGLAGSFRPHATCCGHRHLPKRANTVGGGAQALQPHPRTAHGGERR